VVGQKQGLGCMIFVSMVRELVLVEAYRVL
jgi:hypothetical protein